MGCKCQCQPEVVPTSHALRDPIRLVHIESPTEVGLFREIADFIESRDDIGLVRAVNIESFSADDDIGADRPYKAQILYLVDILSTPPPSTPDGGVLPRPTPWIPRSRLG